jgi:4,5-dihydroxyphthalate decarboxylase
VERDWYERTRLYPIMHVIVLRRDVVDAHPWVAMNLVHAFTEARRRSVARSLDLNASRFPCRGSPRTAEA